MVTARSIVAVTDPRIDDYIARSAPFAQPILVWLRARVHAACPAVEESIKWSMPAFSVGGRPLANMAAFTAHASFGFWNRDALATGRKGEAMGRFGRIAALSDLPDAAAMEAVIAEAAALAAVPRARRAAPAPKGEAEVPPALTAALDADPLARATFNGFPPGQRREYCTWIAEAKRVETRDKRVVEAITWLREGKRRNWKYERC